MDSAEIKKVIQDYFDGSYDGIGEKMEGAFHDAAHVYGHGEGGTLNDMTKAQFVKLVGTPRPRLPESERPRQDEILSIDFTGENTAVARVKLRVGKTLFTDVLCFMRLEGRWGIISKVFSGERIE
jgi:hypothetical protein